MAINIKTGHFREKDKSRYLKKNKLFTFEKKN